MKSISSKIISIFLIVMALISVSSTAFAAEDEELTINDNAKVKVGDRIKYTLCLADTTDTIIGFELRLFYDHNYLELDKNSLNFDKFNGVIYNTELEDMIPINWTNISSPADFSKKATFLSVEFRVLKSGETDISQFVSEMYGDDMTYLKSYTWTYDISVNDETIVSDQVPKISEDEDTLQKKQGGIINYLDGKGEENTPDKDNHSAVIGYTVVATEYVDVTKDVSNSNQNGNTSVLTTVIIGAAVLIVIIAVAGVLIVRKRNTSTDSSEGSTNNDFSVDETNENNE